MRVRWIVLAAVLSLSCRGTARDDVKALALRGQEGGTRLAEYYESLARDSVDAWELSAFRRGFLRLPDPAGETRKSFEAQYKALRARARLARRLSNVYESLGSLASYEGADKITAAVTGLEDELKAVAESPLDVSPRGDVFDALLKAIATWKQNRELRSGARLLEEAAVGVDALFRSERELYNDIEKDRADKYLQIATELVKAKEVVSVTLVDRVLSAYGLSWPDSKVPFDDPRTIAGVLEVIDARARTFEAKAEDEAQAVSRALRALLDAHEGIGKK